MDFSQKARHLSARSKLAAAYDLTEVATKTAVVLPFIQTLGFDVFNRDEVVPEFNVGGNDGERIDFALKIDGRIAILIEVRPISTTLSTAQDSQLHGQFRVTGARLIILTNGKEAWFFSDTGETNQMDGTPSVTFDLTSLDDMQIRELSRFQKSVFAINAISEPASTLAEA